MRCKNHTEQTHMRIGGTSVHEECALMACENVIMDLCFGYEIFGKNIGLLMVY